VVAQDRDHATAAEDALDHAPARRAEDAPHPAAGPAPTLETAGTDRATTAAPNPAPPPSLVPDLDNPATGWPYPTDTTPRHLDKI